MEQKEPLCTGNGNANWCSHSRNHYGVPQELELPLRSSNLNTGYESKANENSSLKICLYLHVYCGIIQNSQDNLNAYQSMYG